MALLLKMNLVLFINTANGHALNLAASDSMRSKMLRDTLDTTNEMSKLLKFSPRQDTTFERIKSEIFPVADC